jgi:hypothetical protein
MIIIIIKFLSSAVASTPSAVRNALEGQCKALHASTWDSLRIANQIRILGCEKPHDVLMVSSTQPLGA